MWELDFGVIELSRASVHGRADGRREERMRSDVSVVVISEERAVASGWCLDRSPSGARVIIDAGPSASLAVGEHLQVYLGEAFFVGRVVWVIAEGTTCVLGLERGVTQSGEYLAIRDAMLEDTQAA